MLSSTNWENLKVPCNAHKKDAARYHSVTWTVSFHSEPWSTCQWMVCHRRIHNCYSLVCQKDRFKGCDSCRGTCQYNGRSSYQVVEEIRTTCTIFKNPLPASVSNDTRRLFKVIVQIAKSESKVFFFIWVLSLTVTWLGILQYSRLQTSDFFLLQRIYKETLVTNLGLFLPLVSKSFSYFAKSSRNQSLIFCISAGRRF